MSIIRAIVAGDHNPQTLAALRHPRSRRRTTEIAQALQGDYRQEHLFILQQELTLYDAYQVQIAACDAQIEQCLSTFEVTSDIALPVAGSPRRKPQDNQPAFDLQTHLEQISGVDFTKSLRRKAQTMGFDLIAASPTPTKSTLSRLLIARSLNLCLKRICSNKESSLWNPDLVSNCFLGEG
ncbi:hypothetical protein NG798_24645 [Ancylothrix sp. C2]|uniref:hypothetical protein n=1 Tax=Ancylothrix sp. D3o TaxID=2953691 RepID=UPI0021BAF9FC|nr:hypothetical protein [Ancylothrix sp. D3o]MCT7952992.1 hypothetical protein [Ancylothrix sp. D3o]